MIKPLYIIIEDEYGIYNPKDNNYIIVKNDLDYIKSRVAIEKVKNNNNKLEIVIRNNDYFNYYFDLKELGELTEINEKNPLEEFKIKFNFTIPNYITNEYIANFNLLGIVNEFNNYFNNKLSFKLNLFFYMLEMKEPQSISNILDLIRFLSRNIIEIAKIKNDEMLMDIFKEIILDSININKEFKLDIIHSIKNDKLNDYLDFLLSCYIFSNYKKYHFKNMLTDINLFNSRNFDLYYNAEFYKDLKPYFIDEYNKNEALINKLNNRLEIFEDKLDIFSEEYEYEYYLKNVSGLLEFEFDYIATRLLKNIKFNNIDDLHLAIVTRIQEKFKLLINNNLFKIEFYKLKTLMNYLYEMQHEDINFDDFTEWADFYVEKYLKWNNYLEDEKNIFEIIKSLSRYFKLDLSSLLENIKVKMIDINNKYEEYLFSNYNYLLSSEKNLGNYSRLNQIKKIINKGTPVILIVIDALRWDLWSIINNIFEQRNYLTNKKMDQYCLSLIPSVTNISRNSFFAGMRYNTLQNKKINEEFRFSTNNEEKHLKSYFKNKKVVFSKGGKDDFRDLAKQESDLYAFIFTGADDMFHGLKDINYDLIKSLFENQIKNIVNLTNTEDNLANAKIIITTDHGSINIKDKVCRSFNSNLKEYISNKNLKINSHGRYLKIYGDYFDEELYLKLKQELKEHEKDYWYIIDRDLMHKFYLPLKEEKGINYFWLINKHEYYNQGTKGEYAHGGLSMSETIIPFAVLERSSASIKSPDISIIDYELIAEQNSYIKLSIINNSLYTLRNIRISSENLGIYEEIELVENKIKNYTINLIPVQSGNYKNELVINYQIAGNSSKIIIDKNLVVRESNKTKINKSLKDSRELF